MSILTENDLLCLNILGKKFMEQLSCVFFKITGTKGVVFVISFDNVVFTKTFNSIDFTEVYDCFVEGTITTLMTLDGKTSSLESFQ